MESIVSRGVLVILALVASLSTALWLSRGSVIALDASTAVLSGILLLGTLIATAFNLLARWFRWHFLLRRFDVRLRTRASLLVFIATLPAILTPLYVGELLRSCAFLRQKATLKRDSFSVWFIERGTDAGVLVAFCLWKSLGISATLLALAVGAAPIAVLLHRLEQARTKGAARFTDATWLALTLLASSVVAWALPVAALTVIVNALVVEIPGSDAAFAFGASTLLGGVTGIPAGIAVAGSAEIYLLERAHDSQMLAWAVAIFRTGTVWFSVGLGVVVFWFKRAQLVATVARSADPQSHFNALAAEYEGEIASHTREKLTTRKTRLIQERLQGRWGRSALCGLDVGCGQGWYALEMSRHGHRMVGVDASQGQVERARAAAAEHGSSLECHVAPASQLPLPDQCVDFAYSINVLHHVLDDGERRACYREIVRVLKPGGVLMLHEMNTENPLFRFYMSYLFPLLKRIDEGNERWISPSNLPVVAGARWDARVSYFTFLPDFLPLRLARALEPIERWLESSRLTRRYSAHFMATLVKDCSPMASGAGVNT